MFALRICYFVYALPANLSDKLAHILSNVPSQ
jgi:hypothetical protein